MTVALALASGCTGHRPLVQRQAAAARPEVSVFYATDRERLPGEPLRYGPKGDAQGALELGRFDLDPRALIRRRTTQTIEQLQRELVTQVQASPRKALLVFIHGYNVTFDEAARRLARLALDLDFEGAVVLYSWPSEARLGGYLIDTENARWTAPHLSRVLKALVERSGAASIHLLAHGLGARPVLLALRKLAAERSAPLFRQLVLIAPDVDPALLREAAPALRSTARRVTLYASSNDLALFTTRRYQGGPRAGDSEPKLTVIRGVDTIDASAVDTSLLGRSQHGDHHTMLGDLRALLRDGLEPSKRAELVVLGNGPALSWSFER